MTDYISTIPTNASDGGDALLREVIQERLGPSPVAPIVAAVTGLLARVAFADRRFEPSELDRIRKELRALADFGSEDVDVICDVLSTHIESVGVGPTSGFSQVLEQLLDADARVTMLKVLIELAMADGHVFQLEVSLLSRVAAELGLDPALAASLIEAAREGRTPGLG